MPEKQKEQLISQSGVLSMGFTKSMIDKLLPPPILKRNPHYASSAPMKLWREDDVRSVMGTQEFQTMAAKAAARKAASAKAVETKRKNAEGIADNLIASIYVTRWDMSVLEEATLNASASVRRKNSTQQKKDRDITSRLSLFSALVKSRSISALRRTWFSAYV